MKVTERFLTEAALNKIEEIKVNGVAVSPVNKSIDLLIVNGDETLELASTITDNTDVLVRHIGGRNEVTAATNITVTAQPDATILIPLNTPVIYQQIGAGNILSNIDIGNGEVARTYKRLDTLVLMRVAADSWIAINPPRPNVISGGLTSSIIGEMAGAREITNIVKIYEKNFNPSLRISGTTYIVEPDLTLLDFGDIITSWNFRNQTETIQDEAITNIVDQYGSNDGVKIEAGTITLNIVDGKKEIKLNGSGINVGLARNLVFLNGTESFTLVFEIGSDFVLPVSGEELIFLTSKKLTANLDYSYRIIGSSGYLLNKISNRDGHSGYNMSVLLPNSRYIITYNRDTRVIDTYINGSLNFSFNMTETPTWAQRDNYGNVFIGSADATTHLGNMSFKGIHIFNNYMEEEQVQNLDNFLIEL
jgi:hypothetical protein